MNLSKYWSVLDVMRLKFTSVELMDLPIGLLLRLNQFEVSIVVYFKYYLAIYYLLNSFIFIIFFVVKKKYLYISLSHFQYNKTRDAF